jgi:hypothetical protein
MNGGGHGLGAAAAAGGGSGTPKPAAGLAGGRTKVGERGRDGTIRFIINPDREREERAVVESYARD